LRKFRTQLVKKWDYLILSEKALKKIGNNANETSITKM